MNNKNIIIIALIAIIVILLVGIIAVMPNFNKIDTNLNFNSNSTLNEEDSLQLALNDINGNPINGQTVNITITDTNGANSLYSLKTNEKGIGTLKLDKDAGNYTITLYYGGNENYKSCNASENIVINEVVEATSAPNVEYSTHSAYAYRSDGSPLYSQEEVDKYMLQKYGMVDYHIGSNGYIDMDEAGYDDAGNPL